jgi:hypothetical protein
MGATGSAWIKPKKRTGLQPESLKDVPHPRFVRPGQRYFPLDAGNRRKTAIRISRVPAGRDRCEGRREDGGGVPVRLAVSRLLLVTPEGDGRHYRFLGYASRAGYTTHAVVVDSSEAWIRMICPEWHPALPITVARGGVPAELRASGTWVACRGDLGAGAAARVGLTAFRAPSRRFDPGIYPAPRIPATAARAPAGEPCGDIVLFVSEAPEQSEIYINGHPPPVASGAAVYLHYDGRVRSRRTLLAKRPRPNGTLLALTGPAVPVAVPDIARRPAEEVSEGGHGQQSWAWRSWRQTDERAI